jgi:hypothetical protein
MSLTSDTDDFLKYQRKKQSGLTSLAASRSSSRLGKSSCVAACRSSTSHAGSPNCAAMDAIERA